MMTSNLKNILSRQASVKESSCNKNDLIVPAFLVQINKGAAN